VRPESPLKQLVAPVQRPVSALIRQRHRWRLGADGLRLHRRGQPAREHPLSASAGTVLQHRLPTPLRSRRDCAVCRRSAPPPCGCQRPPPTPSRRPRSQLLCSHWSSKPGCRRSRVCFASAGVRVGHWTVQVASRGLGAHPLPAGLDRPAMAGSLPRRHAGLRREEEDWKLVHRHGDPRACGRSSRGPDLCGDARPPKLRLTWTRPRPGVSVRWPGLTIIHSRRLCLRRPRRRVVLQARTHRLGGAGEVVGADEGTITNRVTPKSAVASIDWTAPP
jgi:hypothetical protein